MHKLQLLTTRYVCFWLPMLLFDSNECMLTVGHSEKHLVNRTNSMRGLLLGQMHRTKLAVLHCLVSWATDSQVVKD